MKVNLEESPNGTDFRRLSEKRSWMLQNYEGWPRMNPQSSQWSEVNLDCGHKTTEPGILAKKSIESWREPQIYETQKVDIEGSFKDTKPRRLVEKRESQLQNPKGCTRMGTKVDVCVLPERSVIYVLSIRPEIILTYIIYGRPFLSEWLPQLHVPFCGTL